MATCPYNCATVDYYYVAEGLPSLKVRFFLKDGQAHGVGILRQYRNRRWLQLARYKTGQPATDYAAQKFLEMYLHDEQQSPSEGA